MDVVVIGAGLGGLAAAIDCAARGLSVLVLERGDVVGGKASTTVIDGVTVDTGPSVLTLPGVFDELLRAAGTSLAAEAEVFRPSPACRYHYPDGLVLDVFSDHERTRDAIRSALGEEAARDFARFLDQSRTTWDAAAPWFVMRDAPSPTMLLSLGPRAWMDLTRVDAFRTMDGAIDATVRSPALRWLLRRYATYNGSDPRVAPATLNCIAHVELGLGVYGVRGGVGALVDALLRVAIRLGVEVRTSSPVRAIRTVRGRAHGVTLADGTDVDARAVVANADTRHVLRDLLPAGTRHGLEDEPTPSTSGWVGIYRARRRADRPPHAVLFPSDYAREFIDLFDHDRPPQEPTVYLCAQEKAHGRSGWAEHEPLFVMANAPAEPAVGERDPQLARDLRARVEARLHAAGLIDPDDAVVWDRTPAGLAARFPGTRGAIYGAASNDRFAAFRRPPNRVSSVPGLYLASGSAHPGGGMPLCALSGRAAARAVLADLGR